jgi:hypothetical protein
MTHKLTLFSSQTQVCVEPITRKQFDHITSSGMTYDESSDLFDEASIIDGSVFDERALIEVGENELPDSKNILRVLFKKARTKALAAYRKSRAANKSKNELKRHYAVSVGYIKRSWSTLEIKEVFDLSKLSVVVEMTDVIGLDKPIETFRVFHDHSVLELDRNDGVSSSENYLVSAEGKIVDIELID